MRKVVFTYFEAGRSRTEEPKWTPNVCILWVGASPHSFIHSIHPTSNVDAPQFLIPICIPPPTSNK